MWVARGQQLYNLINGFVCSSRLNTGNRGKRLSQISKHTSIDAFRLLTLPMICLQGGHAWPTDQAEPRIIILYSNAISRNVKFSIP